MKKLEIIESNASFNQAVLDSLILPAETIYFLDVKKSQVGTQIIGCGLGTYNNDLDTVYYNNQVYIELNPFPNVFLYDTVVGSVDNDTNSATPINSPQAGVIGGELHISFHSNNTLASLCIYNNSFGTVKMYWDNKGRKIKKGAFFINQRNGVWEYYNKKGIVIGTELYNKGRLIELKGRIGRAR